MFLRLGKPDRRSRRFPHAGGDVSVNATTYVPPCEFSPRRWGCFRRACVCTHEHRVFPTQVGMFPYRSGYARTGGRFPHAGGDVSDVHAFALMSIAFSPRRWGCFHIVLGTREQEVVFPTQVGMFPRLAGIPLIPDGFPHAGGDVSGDFTVDALRLGFSPRRWGCFCEGLRSCR